jgi:uroporphyrinogen III methyltransferase/synthase
VSLRGKRVLIARAEGQTEGPAKLLRDRGAEPVVNPSIAILPPHDVGSLFRALKRATEFDWVVFTSANGVEQTWRALFGESEVEAFRAARFAVVGTGTREALEARGGRVSVEAKEFRGAGLAVALLDAIKEESRTARVLLLRAEEASDVLPRALTEAGVKVEIVAAYRTLASAEGGAAIRRRLAEGTLDVVVFSSGSTVDSICDALGPSAADALAAVTVACIGPVTLDAARARGVRVDVVPDVATFAAVIDALDAHFPWP